MAEDKLKQFLLDNFKWEGQHIGDDDMVADVVIMYRTVTLTGDTAFIPERIDFVPSAGCAFSTVVAMIEWNAARLGHFMEKVIAAEDEEEEDGEEG